MACIGTFKKTGTEYTGEIVTLSVQAKAVRITAETDRTNDNAPSHRVFVGRAEIGAAWTKRSAETDRDYLSVTPDAQNWLVSATRFMRLLRGKPVPDSRITSQRRSRLRQILRALDARYCGASHRAIAEALFGNHLISGPDWHESSLRYATIRLIRDGQALVEGGYLELLKHRGSH